MVFRRCTAVYDAQHRFAPQYDDNDTVTVPAAWVLLSIGQSIQWGGLLEGSAVELGRGNTAQADPLTFQTAQKDVFVGGDCYSGPRFAIDAIHLQKKYHVEYNTFEGIPLKLTPNMVKRVGRIAARSVKDVFTGKKD